MRKFFDVDGPLFSGLSRLADLFWLNVLFLVCCVPVVTIGASASALYYVTLKMVKNEEGYITRSFFKAFKDNLRQATGIWLIAMVVGAVLLGDWLIINGTLVNSDMIPEMARKVLLVLILIVLLVYVFTLRYVFPLLAKFDNTVKNTLKNALLISIRHLPYTAVLVAIPIAAAVAVYFYAAVGLVMILIGFSTIAYFSSKLFVKIFANYINEDENESEEEVTE